MPSTNKLLLSSLLIAFALFTDFTSSATLLPDSEVEALKEIANTLGKTDWNFTADPCSGEWGWATKNPVRGSENAVNCSCTDNTVCHVVSIELKSQNLGGSLPSRLVKLPYLRVIDLSRNYLSGSIPPEWGSMQLQKISLLGNRLTGSIPTDLGNISTLTELSLEFNQLWGVLPRELGNLASIQKMHLTSNNFTGELPQTFARLITLQDFRVGDNQFTGKIPDFIENLTNLNKLVIQGSGLSGPIPSGIALLTKMTDLRISDLNGTEATFPPLSAMTNLETLILRSCNIVGQLPSYLGVMTKLTDLDLSFNKLNGEIPAIFSGLSGADFMYLTGNMLTGAVPDWMLNTQHNYDLSYNNFTSDMSRCQDPNVNLFRSSSQGNNSCEADFYGGSHCFTSGIVSCLRSVQCLKKFYSIHINCGGKQETVDGNTIYEGDLNSGGPSNFYQGGTNWAVSSTGDFKDDGNSRDSFIGRNVSRLTMKNFELYTTARLSPLSLTYYGFCLENGKYRVKLHFAEITFTDDKTFSSLGRRLFNVYVQDELFLKDFNIGDEAGGFGKEIIKDYAAVVTNNTLEIRFYWAGKGTTGIPARGVYGPLISAISVESDPPENRSSILVGAVVSIVAGAVLFVFLIIGIVWWRRCLRRTNTMDQDLRCLDLQTGLFTLRQIKAATDNFDASNKIGEGGFGPVYKGLLSDGTVIAVKQLSSKSKQGNREFVNEIGMISALQHPHLVKLYGCCIEGNQLLLIYEYMENNSLARALFGPEECQLQLDWPTRHRICIGIARGLAYLHEESRLKIVHRDIKATNVLLDKDLKPKISDFGLAKLDEEDNTHISTRIAGTFGYMAPEYAMRGYLTDKADVYSFGIVALEIVCGRSNASNRPKEECTYLLDWALSLKEKGKLMDLIDPRLGSDFNREEVMAVISIALLCTNISPTVRPAMSSVVSMLEGRTPVQDIVSDPNVASDDLKLKEMRELYRYIQEKDMEVSESKPLTMSDGLWPASSSLSDLYPVNLNSEYWENRN